MKSQIPVSKRLKTSLCNHLGAVKLWAVAVPLVVVAVVYAVPYWYTSNPKSCTRCHEMGAYYQSWQDSMHSAAAKNCFFCHVRPGFFSLFYYRITFYREIYASVSGANLKPAGATLPGTDSCRRAGCHSLNRVSSISGDIKIDHRHHVLQAKVACITCHPGTAHPNVGKDSYPTPPRELCKGCHRARMKECSMCHVKKFSAISGFQHD